MKIGKLYHNHENPKPKRKVLTSSMMIIWWRQIECRNPQVQLQPFPSSMQKSHS